MEYLLEKLDKESKRLKSTVKALETMIEVVTSLEDFLALSREVREFITIDENFKTVTEKRSLFKEKDLFSLGKFKLSKLKFESEMSKLKSSDSFIISYMREKLDHILDNKELVNELL